jgi:broad specificity phosphatase PhoE
MRRIACLAALLIAAAQTIPASAASFLFIRHAESTSNANTATTIAEVIDAPLTALGHQQAQDLAGVLAGYDITTIYTSALQRTKQTIAPTAAQFGLTPITDARTNEWYIGDATSLAELGQANPLGIIGAWAAGNTAAKANLPNAESLDDLAARVVPAWQEIINLHKDEDGVVVLVGHGAETGMVMPYFAENVTPSFAFSHGLHNTGIVQLEIINGLPYVTNWQGTALQTPVPEPSTWLMLIVGFGAIGAALRKQKGFVPRLRLARPRSELRSIG